MNFALTILGVSGAAPAHGRFPTSQYLTVQNHHFLIDCGEGAQMRMSDFGVPRQKIEHLFISHLHGDHVFGLPGLIFSYALSNRKKPLQIHSTPGLEQMILAQLAPGGQLPFPLIFHPFGTKASQVIFENKTLTVSTIPLQHRTPTCGFLFKEKEYERNMRPEKIKAHQLSVNQIKAAKRGDDLHMPGGQTLPNEELTLPPFRPRSFAFISDSIFDPSIVPFIKGVDLLYHETTFLQCDAQRAERTMHSTAGQAACIAQMAQAGKLLTGHYSSRYSGLEEFRKEAMSVFSNTELGLEGKTYTIKRQRKNPV